MHFGHIKILIWEHWRRCVREVLTLTVLASLLLLGLYMYLEVFGTEYYSGIKLFCYVIMGITCFFSILVSTSVPMTMNNGDIQLSFSIRDYYLRLPVKPWVLAATRITLNTFTLFMSTFILTWVSMLILKDSEMMAKADQSFLYLLIQVAGRTLFIYFVFTIALLSDDVDTVDEVKGFLTTIFFLGFTALVFSSFLKAEWYLEHHAFTYGLPILFLISIYLSSFDLRYRRSGESLLIRLKVYSLVYWISKLFAREGGKELGAFNSSIEAQCWLERKYMLTICRNALIAFLLFSVNIMLWLYIKDNSSFLKSDYIDKIIACFMFAFVFISFVLGSSNTLSNSSQKQFVFTKPIKTGDIALARFHTLLSLLLKPGVCLFILGLVYLYCNVSVWGIAAAPPGKTASDALFYYIEEGWWILICVLCAGWCITWCGIFAFIFYLFVSLVISFLIVHSLFNITVFDEQDIIIYSILITLIPIIGFWIYSSVKRVSMLSIKSLYLFPVIFFGIYTFIEKKMYEFGNQESIMITIYLSTLVYLPFASVPGVMHWKRHR